MLTLVQFRSHTQRRRQSRQSRLQQAELLLSGGGVRSIDDKCLGAIAEAKWMLDHGEAVESLYELVKDSSRNKIPKTNLSGNPVSHGITYLAGQAK